MAYRIVIGNIGSDAGYTVIDGTGVHHVGGWAPEQYAEVETAGRILRSAIEFKKPGLTEETIKAVVPYLQEQLSEHLGDNLPDGSAVFIM